MDLRATRTAIWMSMFQNKYNQSFNRWINSPPCSYIYVFKYMAIERTRVYLLETLTYRLRALLLFINKSDIAANPTAATLTWILKGCYMIVICAFKFGLQFSTGRFQMGSVYPLLFFSIYILLYYYCEREISCWIRHVGVMSCIIYLYARVIKHTAPFSELSVLMKHDSLGKNTHEFHWK